MTITFKLFVWDEGILRPWGGWDRACTNLFIFQDAFIIKMIQMKFDNIMRCFTIACAISIIAVLIEAAYFGLNQKNTYYTNNTAYSITAPFVNNFSDISNQQNILILIIIFVVSFLLVSNLISKRE